LQNVVDDLGRDMLSGHVRGHAKASNRAAKPQASICSCGGVKRRNRPQPAAGKPGRTPQWPSGARAGAGCWAHDVNQAVDTLTYQGAMETWDG
jgi:hypothetical protein